MLSALHVSLQRSSGAVALAYGAFSAPKVHEVVIARPTHIEMLRADQNGTLHSVATADCFGTMRAITTFRLSGANQDYLVLGTDSGKLTILEFSNDINNFQRVHSEPFGKSGLRRIVPGQYVATDPHGRALMVGAIEKQKFVYILNRDSKNQLTISSPLEAHCSNALTFSIVGVDVGFENPTFAALEVDMEEAINDSSSRELLFEKRLVYYELDLGLNHVVRKWSDAVDPKSNLLVAVPGGSDGPGGVLVCSENFVVFKDQGQEDVRCALPRRRDLQSDHGLLIISSTVHKQRDLFFILLQSELGDIYKVTIDMKGEQVSELCVRYLDTVPPCSSMCILRSGFLFCASDTSSYGFYQFQGTGDDSLPCCTSTSFNSDQGVVAEIELRPLKNLLLVDEVESMCPIMDSKLLDLGERGAPPSLVTLCGRSSRSSLRVLNHGLTVSELAVSDLPGNPSAVWTVKRKMSDEYDEFIVVSFLNGTLVLAIGETIEEVAESGLKLDTQTLWISLMGEDSIVQVHPFGIHHLRADKRVNEWKPPRGKSIVTASSNNQQLVIALQGGEIIYFEVDANGSVSEFDKKDFGHEISCLEVGFIPVGRARSRFLALGGWDNTVRIVSLDPEDCMNVLAVLALPAQAVSVSLMHISLGRRGSPPAVFLVAGLHNGVLLRAQLDPQSGELSDSRTRLLGGNPVKLFHAQIGEADGVLVFSSRPWVLYRWQGALQTLPLAYQNLMCGCSFASEHCRSGIVSVTQNKLVIFSLDKLGSPFNADTVSLRYTPRRLAHHSVSGNLVVIESDHNSNSAEDKARIYEAAGIPAPLPADAILPEDHERESMPVSEENMGVPLGGNGKWASCIRVVDPAGLRTLSVLELCENEAAISVAAVPIRERGGEIFIIVGTVKDMELHPRKVGGGFIHVYGFTDGNTTLQLIHKTPVDDAPAAIAHLAGRILVGVGKSLRMYEMGQKRLLRKAELRGLPTMVRSIHVLSSSRIVVGDLAESFHFVSYKPAESKLNIFADTTVPRYLTAGCAVDYSTMAGADKFGNIFFVRLAAETPDDIDDASLLATIAGNQDAVYLNGAPSKADEIVQFHVGETVTSLQKVTLAAGCAEIILYTTLLGGIGALMPITQRDDVDFCVALEMHLRQEVSPLCGRDQLAFRSAYFPVKGVVDGDFLRCYTLLDDKDQKSIADELDRTPSEISRKLEELASRIA